MIKYVKEGRVIFSESDNGEFEFFDENMKTNFEEGSVESGPSAFNQNTLEGMHSELHRLFGMEQNQATKERITKLHANIVAQMQASGLEHAAVDSLDG
jgi:3-oxoacyl-[acyl-carrier-protein] synthase III